VRVAWVTEALPDSLVQAFCSEHQIGELWEAEPGLATHKLLPAYHVPDGLYRPDTHIDTLWLLGEGLTPGHSRLDSVPRWQHIPRRELTEESPTPTPSFEYDYQQQLGLPISLAVRIDWPTDGGSLVWRGPAGLIDSVASDSAGNLAHRLSTFPTQAGRYLHQWEITTNTDTLTYPVPFVIAPAEPLDILMLSGFPSFEHRTLKNWLGEAGHRVAIRAQLSAERFRSEFINRPQTNLNRISPRLLADYKLVMIDAPVLASLSASEWQTLQAALNEGEIGLWIQLPEDFTPPSVPRYIRQRLFPSLVSGPERLLLEGQAFGTTGRAELLTSPWQSAGASGSEKKASFIQWAEGFQQNIYLHRIYNTYELVLTGQQDLYRRYWSAQLNEAAVAYPSAVAWKPSPSLMFAGKPQTTGLILQEGTPRGVLLQEGQLPESLPIVQNLYEPVRWEARWQPATPGWVGLALTEPARDTLWAYVLPDTTYPELQRTALQNAFAKASQEQKMSSTETTLVAKPIPAFWWWGLALFCLAFLWIEPKL